MAMATPSHVWILHHAASKHTSCCRIDPVGREKEQRNIIHPNETKEWKHEMDGSMTLTWHGEIQDQP